jgi:(R,R)-butanediol dehydrogenase/meso-butanediol dehydrogenase/diacetyl reductase
MKAVAYRAPQRLEVEEMPEPTPAEGEVVVAVAYCGICGSDLHEYLVPEGTPAPRLMGAMWTPVMGHELTGVVSAVGKGVSDRKEGDPVVVNPGDPCLDCYYCKQERYNLCIRPHHGIGYTRPGGYSQYLATSAKSTTPLPSKDALKYAALSEPFGVALHGVNRGDLLPGETLLIVGGGPIGLLTLLSARQKGAGTIIVSEMAPGRRELAKRVGADVVVDPKNESLSDAVKSRTDGLGADIAIECVGTPQPMADCIANTRKGGRIVVAGAFDRPFQMDLLQLLLQEQSIIGTFGSATELGECAELISSGKVDVSPVVSSVIGLDDVPTAFADLAADRGSNGKILVRPNPEIA